MSETRFPKRFGKYILLDRINSGGMAEVYRAKVRGVESFERMLAIKCMLPQLAEDQAFTTMFIDEAKLAAQLNHPNIVQIYELGRHDDRLYIAMELVNGRDLRHVVRMAQRKNVSLPAGFAAYVIAKAAEGLDFAHRKHGIDGQPLNLVHRDVSPQNILVSYDGDVKVVDFGIAKAEARATETQAGVLKGKFAYMAPEQVMGQEIDRRADIFALTAVLYEVLTGKKLFHGDSDLSILDKVRRADVGPVEAALVDAPAELAEIFARGLARDKEQRYSFGSELAEDLEPLLIDNRNIFGAKRASQLMHTLYEDEIAMLAERMKDYARVGNDDVSVAGPDSPKTQIFSVSSAATAPPPRGGTAVAGMSQEHSGSTQIVAPPEGSAKTTVAPTDASLSGAISSWTGGDPVEEQVPTDEVPKASDAWAQAEAEAAQGQELWSQPTALFESPSVAAARREASQPSVSATAVSQAVEEPGVAPRSGISPPVLGGIAASVVIAVAAVAVAIVHSRPKQAAPVVISQALPTTAMGGIAKQNVAPAATPAPSPPAANPSRVKVVASADPPPAASDNSKEATTVTDSAPPPAKVGRVSNVLVKKSAPAQSDGDESRRRVRYGFLSVMAVGVSAKVLIDGKEIGYSPLLNHRVKTGKHQIKLVEEGGGRTKSKEVDITAKDTKKAAQKVIVRF